MIVVLVVVGVLVLTCADFKLWGWLADRRFQREWEKMSDEERRRLQESAHLRSLPALEVAQPVRQPAPLLPPNWRNLSDTPRHFLLPSPPAPNWRRLSDTPRQFLPPISCCFSLELARAVRHPAPLSPPITARSPPSKWRRLSDRLRHFSPPNGRGI